MRSEKVVDFQSLTENVGRFDLRDKTVLFPEMARIGSHVLTATFRGFGINAKVLETCKGLDLGMEYTSGKECYPCQITMGDILYFLKKEQENQGDTFNPEKYVYFMPEAGGLPVTTTIGSSGSCSSRIDPPFSYSSSIN